MKNANLVFKSKKRNMFEDLIYCHVIKTELKNSQVIFRIKSAAQFTFYHFDFKTFLLQNDCKDYTYIFIFRN